MEVVPMTHAGHDVALDHLVRNSQDNDLTSSSDAKSLPASQASSFGESPTSQLAGQHDLKEASQSPTKYLEQIPEPLFQLPNPTEHADPQHVPINGATNPTIPAVPRINTTITSTETTSARMNAIQHEIKQGQKRTASGHIKTPSSSTMTSPASATNKGHTRQSSSTSQVGELTAQLRARLSYAMVKVQHGWETRTIDEVETLAVQPQQQPSPMSAISSPQRNFSSPRSNISSQNPQTESSLRTTLPGSGPLSTIYSNTPMIHHDHAYTTSSQPSYTYTNAHPSTTATTSSTTPSLAPPVDFSQRPSNTTQHPRRISKPLSPHPSLLNGSRHPSNLSQQSSTTSLPSKPHTPPQAHSNGNGLLKTPSQRSSATAMEKEAVETLLFMSSPGNSQGAASHIPATSLQPQQGSWSSVQQLSQAGHGPRMGSAQPTSPLRSGFLVNGGGNGVGVSSVNGDERIMPRRKEAWETGGFKDEASIDRVLDQMIEREGIDGDSSDEDEDDAVGLGVEAEGMQGVQGGELKSEGGVGGAIGRGLVYA